MDASIPTTAPPPASATIPALEWQCHRLVDLQPLALHRILRARQDVFVVEQSCVFPDADETDESSWHLAAWGPDLQLAACARIVDPGAKYPEASIGRVLTTRPFRRTGLGRELLRRAIALAGEVHPGVDLRISAQSHLEDLYAGFGFRAVGEQYLEDGILHTEMVRRWPGSGAELTR